jgi:hypothetical protein
VTNELDVKYPNTKIVDSPYPSRSPVAPRVADKGAPPSSPRRSPPSLSGRVSVIGACAPALS